MSAVLKWKVLWNKKVSKKGAQTKGITTTFEGLLIKASLRDEWIHQPGMGWIHQSWMVFI